MAPTAREERAGGASTEEGEEWCEGARVMKKRSASIPIDSEGGGRLGIVGGGTTIR